MTTARDRSSARATLAHLLVISRPRFWLYLAGPVLVGVAHAARSPGDLLEPAPLALFAYFLVPANVFLYGVNDVFDADVDAENPKKAGREARYGGDRLVPAAAVAAGLLGLGLFALLPRNAWLPLAGFFALALGYSAPPARFKARPVLDSVSNGLYVLPGVAAYAALAGAYPPALVVLAAWLWTMAMHTFSAIPDVAYDREAGVETTATLLGAPGALAYCGVVWLGAAVAFGLAAPRAGLLLGVYPVVTAGVAVSTVTVRRAYWWFPALNAAVGTVLTLAGLWRVAGV